jgi:hypothetical protein
MHCTSRVVMFACAGTEQGRESEAERPTVFTFELYTIHPNYCRLALPEWRLDCLLREYGLHDKRRFAMGAFLCPDQR